MNILELVRMTIETVPEVKKYLSPAVRFKLFDPLPYKTLEYFRKQIQRLVTSLYNNRIGGQFIDIMANLISGQLLDAYEAAWKDEGFTGKIPDYLQTAHTEDVLAQYTFVDQFFRDIIDARIDGTGIGSIMYRVDLWANQWTNSYNRAIVLITQKRGGKLQWQEGDTKEKCSTCVALDGIVLYADEWQTLNVHPGDGPNPHLVCGGWNCGCSLIPTDQRRTADGYGKVEEIIL